jgi:hypothetical protein
MAGLPDTLSPQQMAQLQGQSGAAPSGGSLPNTLSPQAMAAMMQSQQPSAAPKKSLIQGASDFIGGLEKPFISLAATPVQLGVKAANALTGGNIPDPFANGVPGGLPGAPSQVTPAPATPAGFLVKAGQAGEIASLAYGGAASGVGKLALAGGAQGLSSSLAAGNNPVDQGGQIVRDTIYGGLFNSLFGAGLNLLGHVGGSELAKTGIGPQQMEMIVGDAQKDINRIDPALLNKYINTTKAHEQSVLSPTPDGIAIQAMRDRANILIDKVIPEAGAAVGAAKKAARSGEIALANDTGQVIAKGKDAAQNLFNDVNEKVGQFTGHQFGSVERSGFEGGRSPVVTRVPGSNIKLSNAENTQLTALHEELDGLMNYKPTIGQAQDAITNIDNMIGKAWNNPKIGDQSPVMSALKYARGAINRSIAPAAPELAQANEAFGSLKDLETEIGQGAGKNLQSAGLFMRRLLTGDKAIDVIPTMQKLDAAVKPYLGDDTSSLIQHSVVADWAKSQFGGATAHTAFTQGAQGRAALNQGTRDATSILGYPKQWASVMINRGLGFLAPDAEKYAMSLAKGESYSPHMFDRFLTKALDSASSAPILKNFTDSAKSLGLTPENEVKFAKDLFKAYIISRLAQPNQQANDPNAPMQPNLPAGVPQQGQPISQAAPQGRTLSIAAPAQQAINNTASPTSGQQFSSQARQLGDFGMNMGGTNGLRVT